MDPSATVLPTELQATLQRRFGLSTLRGLQAQVISRVLARQDVLALMPTGAGKSLCYQLPCCLRPGLMVVISPLLALMRDQLQRLTQVGIPARALTGRLNAQAMRQLSLELQNHRWRVLLLSPERALKGDVAALLSHPACSARVDLLVVDEAHCIAEWGPAFRPAFAALGNLRARFPAASVLALTASADLATRRTILEVLQINGNQVLETSFNRPELYYRVHVSPSPWRHALAYLRTWHPLDSAIFYCRRRAETMHVAALLRAVGVPAVPYHAGQGAQQRRAAEQWFMQRADGVMVATIAFGMGIDKPDVRLVVHAGRPVSLPSYYQETGRAGRDGQRATALLLLALHDVHPESGGQEQEHLQTFLQGKCCRRRSLLAGLAQQLEEPCTACDDCNPDWHPVPALASHRLLWVPAQ